MGWEDALKPDFGLLGGSSGGGKGPGKLGKKQINFNVLYPLLMQGMMASAALGQDPIEFLSQFKMDKKGFKGAKKDGGDAGFLHIGNSYYDIGNLSKALPGLLQQQEDKKIADKAALGEKLANTPLFAGVFADAKDPTASFDKYYGNAYSEAAGKAGGAASASGFYSDPLKQAAALGPVAFQKAQLLLGMQKSAEAQALGLVGAGSLQGATDLYGAGSPQSYMPGIFNTANMFNQQQQFNAQLGFQKSAQDQDFWAGLAGAGAGAASYGFL